MKLPSRVGGKAPKLPACAAWSTMAEIEQKARQRAENRKKRKAERKADADEGLRKLLKSP